MKSNISNIFFVIALVVLVASIFFLIGERLLQVNDAILLSVKYCTIPFIAISFLAHKKESYDNQLSYIFDKLKIIFICLILAVPSVIAFNKFFGESKKVFISGEVVNTKPW